MKGVLVFLGMFGSTGQTIPATGPVPTVLFSGGVVKVDFQQPYTLGTGTPTVTVAGTPVSCPRYFQPYTDVSFQTLSNLLMIRIPAGSLVPNSSSVVTVTLPSGLISLGSWANLSATNNTGVESLPTSPSGGASAMRIGVNSETPSYFACSIPFADGTKLLSDWNGGGGTLTFDANGYPATISGGPGYAFAFMFRDIGTLWPTGSYLLRCKGAGSVAAYDGNTNLPYSVTGSGSAGGWAYQAVNVTVANTTGLYIRATPPITALELRFPGTWNASTHLPTTDFDPDWATAYGGLNHFRVMDFLSTNDSNVRSNSDLIADGYYSQGPTRNTRSASGTVTGASSSSSTFLGSGFVWLVTHGIAGDPFVTGDWVTTNGEDWLVERISSTQYKTLNFSGTNPNGGAISFAVTPTGILEDAVRLINNGTEDLWVCVPHLMGDSGVTSMATRILAVLNSGRKVMLEYSNECWNDGFHQRQYLLAKGRTSGLGAVVEYANRAADVHKLFLDAFTTAGRSADLVRMLPWQAANSSSGKDVLDAYKARCVAQSYSFAAPHHYAIAPYYGNNVGLGSSSNAWTTQFRDFLMNGSNTSAALAAAQIVDLAVEDLLGEVADWMTSSATMVTTWNTANSAAVAIGTYEGSQTFFGARNGMSGCSSGDGPNYAGTDGTNGAGLAWDSALKRANRHPRMANLQFKNMAQCLAAGYVAWTQFTCDRVWNQFGYWGAREFFNQVVGPGDGRSGGHDNRSDLDDEAASEAVKLWAMRQWAGI